ncbi:unannotated protein [freshwater metagenome]|uniref:Unannotated protein n=1 Tax=freshwater metagenome TaxID=449393 RepID=A0A6J6T832_9ZZZZ
MHREAVMGRDEVDGGVGPAAFRCVEIGRAGQAPAELLDAGRPPPEVAHAVAVLAVPLRPQWRELADLIAAGADIPRLGDELDPPEHRILLDRRHEAAEHVDIVEGAGEGGGEVEPKAVDMHLGDPVSKGVHDELQHVRLGDVERIAAAGVVGVVPAARLEPVVVVIVDAAEGERRAELIALGGVVVHDVEDDLEAGGMQVLHHVLELLHLLASRAGGGVAGVRSEEPDRVVAPVVREPELEEVDLVDEVMGRHELDGGHAECAQVVGDRWMRDAGVGTALMRWNVGMQLREALHVRLVDDGVAPRRSRVRIALPVELVVDDDAPRNERGRVVAVHRKVIAPDVVEDCRVEAEFALDGAGVRIDEQLRGIPAMTDLGLPRSVDPEPVPSAGREVLDVGMKDIEDALGDRDAPLDAIVVEHAQFDGVRALGPERDVCASPAVRGHAEWVPARARGRGPGSLRHSPKATGDGHGGR